MEQTYKEFIQTILDARGRFGIPEGEYKERHHIIPRCMNGGNEEENLIDLYAREHFIAHKLLAIENSDNYQLIYAWHMMCTCGKGDNLRYIAEPEEYELAKILWLPFCKDTASKNTKGRHWYTNGEDDIFDFECPNGYKRGRSDTTKKNIGFTSRGRIINKGKHWYNNGVVQVIDYSCPTGFEEGALPMTDEAKNAHKGPNYKLRNLNTNRGFETFTKVDQRINFKEFSNDFLTVKLNDNELAEKYNITTRMSQKYRRAHKLFMSCRSND